MGGDELAFVPRQLVDQAAISRSSRRSRARRRRVALVGSPPSGSASISASRDRGDSEHGVARVLPPVRVGLVVALDRLHGVDQVNDLRVTPALSTSSSSHSSTSPPDLNTARPRDRCGVARARLVAMWIGARRQQARTSTRSPPRSRARSATSVVVATAVARRPHRSRRSRNRSRQRGPRSGGPTGRRRSFARRSVTENDSRSHRQAASTSPAQLAPPPVTRDCRSGGSLSS